MASIKDNTKKNNNINELKTALQYADSELGITVASSTYAEICDALAAYFPDTPVALIPITTNNTYVIYSSVYTTEETFRAWHAFDNDDSTYWRSALAGSSVDYIGYDFTSAVRVDHVALLCRNSNSSQSWYLQYSDDGSSWNNAGSVSVGTTSTNYTITSSETNKHRYWRVYDATGTSNTMMVYTMQLYGWT